MSLRDAQNKSTANTQLSLLHGSTNEPLWNLTLSQMLHQQVEAGPNRQCLVFPESKDRLTYANLQRRSLDVARSLILAGITRGDRIGIMAGNCLPYVELFFAASHIGAIYVVLSNTYTASELISALKHSGKLCNPVKLCDNLMISGCKLLFTASSIGKLSNEAILAAVEQELQDGKSLALQRVILVKPVTDRWQKFEQYSTFVQGGQSSSAKQVAEVAATISPSDVCNLQFTSGTTGSPKAAMLTHK